MLKIKGYNTRKILPLVMTLANSIINKLGFVELINRSVEWDPDHQAVSPGDLAKTVVLSTFFDIRTPLTHLADRFEGIDMEYFLSPGSKSVYVDSFNAGRALERIGDSGCDKMYETLALPALQQANIPAQRPHPDTATLSFYGEYDIDMSAFTEEEREGMLEIERGYNKDGRPQCKQAVVGQIVNEVGIPVCGRTMDGATADTDWNAQATKYLRELQEKGFRYGVSVADSKLVTHGLVTSMNGGDSPVTFVSRCPANFEGKLEGRAIQKAYAADQWEEIGELCEGKAAASYRLWPYKETVCGREMGLLVLESSILKAKAIDRLAKEHLEVGEAAKKLEKKVFRCGADVEEEAKRFLQDKRMGRYGWEWGPRKRQRRNSQRAAGDQKQSQQGPKRHGKPGQKRSAPNRRDGKTT